MPAVRFSRDKRGYEYVYLVHTPTRRGKPGRTRVLYWYRTPPGVRVGRKPFDLEVQRAVEQQNPGVTFDWPSIINAEMPPPDMTEFWRERRRLEKAARQERRAAEAEETGEAETLEPEPAEPLDAEAAESPVVEVETAASPAEAADVEPAVDAPGESADAAGASPAQKKRRRRRGGRRRKGAVAAAEGGEAGQSDGEGEAADDNESNSSGDEPSE